MKCSWFKSASLTSSLMITAFTLLFIDSSKAVAGTISVSSRFSGDPPLQHCMAVQDGRIRENQKLVLWDCQGKPDQINWTVVGGQIMMPTGDKYLCAAPAYMANEAPIVLKNCDNTTPWRYTGQFKIGDEMCIDSLNGLHSHLILQQCQNQLFGHEQFWTFTP